MKFAHIADVHLGGWKEPRMAELGAKAWRRAVATCISEKMDFVLIAGDLFNTSMPSIDILKLAVIGLKDLKSAGIPVYLIAGSHDFSPSGKTMLDILGEVGLFVDVCKGEVVGDGLKLWFTVDPKTGAKITGMLGKKGQLDKAYYEKLIVDNLEAEQGFKIFMFHTTLTELKTKEFEKVDSAPVSFLPKGFNYYAGGHVHIVRQMNLEGYKNLVYPGPVYPNSFSELEKLGCGSMQVYDDGQLVLKELKPVGIEKVEVDASHKTPELVMGEIVDKLSKDLTGKLVLIRVGGVLESGNASDVGFKRIFELAMENGAYFVLKNSHKLKTKDYEEIKIQASTNEEAEKLVVDENLGQVKSLELDDEREKELVDKLMLALNTEKDEGEKSTDYELRVLREAENIFDNI